MKSVYPSLTSLELKRNLFVLNLSVKSIKLSRLYWYYFISLTQVVFLLFACLFGFIYINSQLTFKYIFLFSVFNLSLSNFCLN